MRITPIQNADIIGRYAQQGLKVVDTWLNKVLYTGSNKQTVSMALAKINRIGLINGRIIDQNARLPKAQQKPLLYYMA